MISRTTLITAASVVGVVVAGAAVVGANIRILDSAAAEGMGELSATTIPVVEEISDAAADESQTYAVDAAGTVAVERYGGELRLKEVTETPGWTHSVTQQGQAMFVLAFTDGTMTYNFLAMIGPDGAINAGVSQPVDEIVVLPGSGGAQPTASGSAATPASPAAPASSSAPAPGQPSANSGGSEHGYEDYDHHDDDGSHEYDERDELEEHEGGEDDD